MIFCHGHIKTGDIRLTENKHLRKRKRKRPSFPKARTITWNICKDITKGIEDFSQRLSSSIENIPAKNNAIAWKNETMLHEEKK